MQQTNVAALLRVVIERYIPTYDAADVEELYNIMHYVTQTYATVELYATQAILSTNNLIEFLIFFMQ